MNEGYRDDHKKFVSFVRKKQVTPLVATLGDTNPSG